jgi:hypothetical protein
MNRETAKTSRFVHVLLRCAGVAAAIVLGGCGGDDPTNPPAPNTNWSNQGTAWNAPFTGSGSYPSTLKCEKIGVMGYEP